MAWSVAEVVVGDTVAAMAGEEIGAVSGLEQAPTARLTRIMMEKTAKALRFKVDILSSGRHWATLQGYTYTIRKTEEKFQQRGYGNLAGGS